MSGRLAGAGDLLHRKGFDVPARFGPGDGFVDFGDREFGSQAVDLFIQLGMSGQEIKIGPHVAQVSLFHGGIVRLLFLIPEYC